MTRSAVLRAFASVAIAVATIVPAANASVAPVRMVRVAVGTDIVTVPLDRLAAAERAVADATPATIAATLASFDPQLRRAVVFTMTHEYADDALDSDVLRPCRDVECEEPATGRDPEPPANVENVPSNGGGGSTCYLDEDERRFETGSTFSGGQGLAYIFHQHAEWCVSGQLIQPGYSGYSWADNIDELWQCQDPQQNFERDTTPTSGSVLFHSTGQCWWSADAGPAHNVGAGRTAPTIHDLYGSDGKRWVRSGSAH